MSRPEQIPNRPIHRRTVEHDLAEVALQMPMRFFSLRRRSTRGGGGGGVCTENSIRVADVMESPKLAE